MRLRDASAHESGFAQWAIGVQLADTSGPKVRKEYGYRRNAVWSLELAPRATPRDDKAHLLKLA